MKSPVTWCEHGVTGFDGKGVVAISDHQVGYFASFRICPIGLLSQ
jgi:hypothetical protein